MWIRQTNRFIEAFAEKNPKKGGRLAAVAEYASKWIFSAVFYFTFMTAITPTCIFSPAYF